MEAVDRSKWTVREVTFWMIKKEKMDAIATDLVAEANNAVGKWWLRD
jgi:hypothetical protein